ncbi:putative gustatory receptor 28a [Phymastichus coffea]|uniref:putative gustatory receptor 28a n=1 Tax=Phymastichus coffea TaxID=108790 RepID=UPI00273A8BB5|nr:putative gustatory receptor 28a [Phymastichus coffea]
MTDSTIVKFLYYSFKGVGLVPMTYIPKKCFCTSTQSLVYNIIFMSYVFAMNCYAVKLTLRDNSAVKFDRIIDGIHSTIGALTSLILIGMYCVHRQKCVEIANKLKALYELSTFHQKYLSTTAIKQTCLLVLFSWISLLLTVPINSYQAILYFIATYFCIVTVSSVMLQYSFFLSFLSQLFVIVNNNFANLKATPKIQFVSLKDQLVIRRFVHQRNLHMSLSAICKELDRFYSLPALLCIFYVFSTLILCAYYVVKSFFFNKTGLSTTFLFNCFAQLIHGSTVLFILTRSASILVEEMNQFSSYLLHENIQFSAAGLFSIDGNLMMSIIGSITTYMVILLQFQDRNST